MSSHSSSTTRSFSATGSFRRCSTSGCIRSPRRLVGFRSRTAEENKSPSRSAGNPKHSIDHAPRLVKQPTSSDRMTLMPSSAKEAQLRDASARNGAQRRAGAGFVGPQRHSHDDDLLARDGRRNDGGAQPAGRIGTVSVRVREFLQLHKSAMREIERLSIQHHPRQVGWSQLEDVKSSSLSVSSVAFCRFRQ